MYEIKRNVEFSDVGLTQKARLANLPKWFQDASINHSEALGVGIRYLWPAHLAWLLTSWQIEINRLPEYDEKLRVQTWPFDFKRAFGYRNYRLLGEEDELLATGYAVWVHTNVEKMQMEEVSPYEVQRYGMDPKLENFTYLPRKIRLPKDMEEVDRWPLPMHFADMHGHLNNVLYVEIAGDYLPKDVQVGQIRVDYRLAVAPEDVLVIRRKQEGDQWFIAFYDEEDRLHVSCSFTSVNGSV